MSRRIGILTGGGDCPGLNAVIRAVAKTAIYQHDIRVFGIEDGFQGLAENRIGELSSFHVSGVLTIGGKDFPLEFPLEIVEHEGGHTVKGRLPTTFAAFEVEVPTVAGGLIARPHEDLELVVHLDPERIEGLDHWAREQGLQ